MSVNKDISLRWLLIISILTILEAARILVTALAHSGNLPTLILFGFILFSSLLFSIAAWRGDVNGAKNTSKQLLIAHACVVVLAVIGFFGGAIPIANLIYVAVKALVWAGIFQWLHKKVQHA
ncbi:hypothetical protein AAFO92_01685 [Roseovarius sp. CAU 1744]|uniref:hypothetical protein n=1 Tax=Roseovarius sp. CAU 1744 TaxID=3140368 RepID=UPI00325A9050